MVKENEMENSTTKKTGTIFEAVGGMDGLQRLSNTFYENVLADPLLAPVFANFSRTHVRHVAVWLAEVFEGPEEFTEELGGHQALLKSHLGLKITEEQRTRWLELMDDAVKKELPEDEQLRRAIMKYFDWGTRIARNVSAKPVDHEFGEPEPTPRWGLDGLK
ncbi:group II truncated hemoglobin [Shimazuella kribbensis]|uniref:group II truncated hemoglobin n=1 Tax=Shimazuella kribbensis TaxID=139808 RepID=UPI00040E6E9E|nr:group II truncated hemoglobin [Shimazuella kribbensis]